MFVGVCNGREWLVCAVRAVAEACALAAFDQAGLKHQPACKSPPMLLVKPPCCCCVAAYALLRRTSDACCMCVCVTAAVTAAALHVRSLPLQKRQAGEQVSCSGVETGTSQCTVKVGNRGWGCVKTRFWGDTAAQLCMSLVLQPCIVCAASTCAVCLGVLRACSSNDNRLHRSTTQAMSPLWCCASWLFSFLAQTSMSWLFRNAASQRVQLTSVRCFGQTFSRLVEGLTSFDQPCLFGV